MIYDAPDWCHYAGITRPTTLPPDDALTELQCQVNGAFDNLATDTFDLVDEL